MTAPNYLYRVVEQSYSAGVDEFSDPLRGGPTRASLLMLPVLKETPCGWWVPEDRPWAGSARVHGWRWVSKTRAIPYACLTKEDAVLAWKQRVSYRVRRAEREIARLRAAVRDFDACGFYYDQSRWTDASRPDAMVEYFRRELSWR